MSRRRPWLLVALAAALVGLPIGLLVLRGSEDAGPGAPAARTVPAPVPVGKDMTAERPTADPGPGEGKGKGNGAGRGKGSDGGPPPQAGPSRGDYPASTNVAYPQDVTASGRPVAAIVERQLGAKAAKADQLTVIGADCRGGRCVARYVSGPHGGGRILSDGTAILRNLFARRGVDEVVLSVHEPHGNRSTAVEPMLLFSVRCRRADAPKLRWARVTEAQVARRCRVVERSPGKLGSRIRKGQLSEQDASRGEEGRASGGSSRRAPEAPRTVKGSYQAQQQ